jgi:hypothetical protein
VSEAAPIDYDEEFDQALGALLVGLRKLITRSSGSAASAAAVE